MPAPSPNLLSITPEPASGMGMTRSQEQTFRLYSIGIEDFDHELYEIVLPGRTHHHARRAAEILLAATGTRAFKRFDLMGPEAHDFAQEYRSEIPRVLPHLFKAYTVLSEARAHLRNEPELLETIEYQIDHARSLTRPSSGQLRLYLQQKALCKLPLAVRRADELAREPANPFDPSSKLIRTNVSAARAFTQTLSKDALEIAALKSKIQEQYKTARRDISRTARLRCASLRKQINTDFAPNHRSLKRGPDALSADPAQSMKPIGALARETLRKATLKAHQQALRTALAPVLAGKRAALRQADQLHEQFQITDRALQRSAKPDLQRQWRAFASEHARQLHGPAQPASAPEQSKPGFLERIGARAGRLRQQSPAPEQNNLPEPD